jgi:hypothetical protein
MRMLQAPKLKRDYAWGVLDRNGLQQMTGSWEDLSARSVEENVYYTPRYAGALLDHLEDGNDIRFAAVWQDQRLVAILPFVDSTFLVSPLGATRGWQSPYTYSGTPLLDREDAAGAAASLIDVLASSNGPEWILPVLNKDGPAWKAMTLALDQKGIPWAASNNVQRATLYPGLSFEDHMRIHVPAKRRRELTRNLRRLEQLGAVRHDSYCSGEGLHDALQAFLALEAGGWKGKQGTALASRENTRRFAEQAFTGEQHNSICRADVRRLNGIPVAAGLIAFAGGTGFTVKSTYDENYRSYGAGLLLEVEVIRSFLSGGWASRLDAATAGVHVIDGLWPGRVEVADLLMSLAPRGAQARLAVLQNWHELKLDLKASMKRLPLHEFVKSIQPMLKRWAPR